MRRLLLSTTCNTRDLGGYTIENGRYTKFDGYIRSECPAKLNDEDVALLRDKHITTIIDLRQDDAIQELPCHFATEPGFFYHNIPMHIDLAAFSKAETVPLFYMGMVNHAPSMQQIFKIIAAAPGGVLYHCSAGKDRTGVISAILLKLAGVAETDIVADYCVSQVFLQPLYAKLALDHPAFMTASDPAYMQGFLALFQEKFGGAAAYLQSLGLSQDEIAQIKAKLA